GPSRPPSVSPRGPSPSPAADRAGLLELLAQPADNIHRALDHRAPPRFVVSEPTREDDAVVSYHPDPRPSFRARLRLALHDSRGRLSTHPYTTSGDAAVLGRPARAAGRPLTVPAPLWACAGRVQLRGAAPPGVSAEAERADVGDLYDSAGTGAG